MKIYYLLFIAFFVYAAIQILVVFATIKFNSYKKKHKSKIYAEDLIKEIDPIAYNKMQMKKKK